MAETSGQFLIQQQRSTLALVELKADFALLVHATKFAKRA